MAPTQSTTDSNTDTDTATLRPSIDSRPLIVRLAVFTAERFPPVPQLILGALMFISGVTLTILLRGEIVSPAPKALTDPHWLTLAAGFAGSLLLLFRLRVFDDVKDADHDRQHEQDRPIPRGLVRERELDFLSALILIAEGALFWYVSTATFYAWLIAAAFTCLMRVEFFVGEWLEAHVLTYAVSHMLSTAPIYATIMFAGWKAGVAGSPPSLVEMYGTPQVALLLVATVLIGVGFELGRKFERYVAAHGKNTYLLLMACPSLGVLCLTLVARIEHWWITMIALGIVAILTVFALGQLVSERVDTSDLSAISIPKKHRDAIEITPGLAGLVAYLVLAAVGLQRMGWW